MNRWLLLLLVAIPAALLAEIFHAPPLVAFVLASLGLVPLASLIGAATEILAEHMGHSVGGLLNATFGNAAEIIIGITALAAGLNDVVLASLAGSIISNILLVLGSSMLVGGWRHRRQVFDKRTAGQYSVMLALVVVGLSIPALLATVGENAKPGKGVVQGASLHELSFGVAIVLLLCYAAYIASSIFGLRTVSRSLNSETTSPKANTDESHPASTSPKPIPEDKTTQAAPAQSGKESFLDSLPRLWKHTIWLPLVVLAAATAVTAVVSEVLVGTIEPLTHEIGLNPLFVGLIVLPIVGNAAEHFSAITSAARNHMEISLAITAGSSIQVALFVAPLLVLVGPLVGTPLNLTFSLFEVTLFGLVAGLYALICIDGESTWLEGLLLCGFYVILAIGAFVPVM
jgi:Ca2+:H+ antiporter